MQPGQTIIIRKSIVGFLVILFLGALLTLALALGALLTQRTGQTQLAYLMYVVAAVTILATFIQAYVYSISRITLTAKQMDVVNWNSLVSQNDAVCEWEQVQDVDFKKGGILGIVFDFGTLLVQTAGTERNLRITNVPNVEHWRDFIAGLADAA